MAAQDYKIRWADQRAVVTMPPEIDVTNAEQIRQALLAAASQGAAALIIDMGGTRFCDSAGVHAIIAARKQAAMTGAQLRLVATAVLRILTLVGVDQLIPIYPSLEAALAATPSAPASPHDPGYEPAGATASSDPQTEPPSAQV